MSIARLPAIAALLGAASGALLSATLVGNPVASADDVLTLPVPPFDPYQYFSLPGTPGAITNATYDDYWNYHLDQAYTVSDGSYEVHQVDAKIFTYFPYWEEQYQHVIASDGIAPAVGTTLDNTRFEIPSFGEELEIFNNDVLTTPDGTVDVFLTNGPYANIFYEGPAGTLDYIAYGYGNSPTFIPIFDIPAAGDTAAAINPADLAGLGDAGSLATLLTEIQGLF